MTSQQPGPNPGQSLSMTQTTNQAPASRQPQQQQLLQGSPNMPTALPGGPNAATVSSTSRPSISKNNHMTGPAGTGEPGPTSGTLLMDLYHRQMLDHQQKQQQTQMQMQMSSAVAGGSGMMSTGPKCGMQQNQLYSLQQQPVGQGGSFEQQPLAWQQQQVTMQNPTIPKQQTNDLTNLQQHQLQIQQNQMQHQKMLLVQNQNEMLGSGGGNMNNMQAQMQMRRQAGHLPQQHLLSQLQSQQQQFPQQQNTSMMQQREMQMPQQWMQESSAPLQIQNITAIHPHRQQQHQLMPQQRQPQQQEILEDVASSPTSVDSAVQTEHPEDWQEKIYEKLRYLKDTYLDDLREVHQKLSIKLSQLDGIAQPNTRGGEQIEKMKEFKRVLEHFMTVLQLGKHSLQIDLKDKLSLYEKQVLSIIQNYKKVPQHQPQAGASSGQLQSFPLQQLQPGMHTQQPQQQQQLNASSMLQSNNLGISNAVKQGMQNTLRSDQILARGMGFGSLQQRAMDPTMQNTMNPSQMVGSGTAIGSSNMLHTITMAGMQMKMSSSQVLKQQQQHQEQQIQPQQRMMPTQQFISQQQPPQQQRILQDVASSPASLDSAAQTGHPGDWREEIYQKLKYLKDTYIADLREVHQRLLIKLNQLDNMVLPTARGGDQVEKMKFFKMVLERIIAVLQLGKQNLQNGLKDKLPLYEKQILSILQNHKKVPQQQPQSGASSDQPQFHTLQQLQSGMQSQQQQSQQIDNHKNQLQQELNASAMPQFNNLGANVMQQGIQNTSQSDQRLASGTGFGSLQQGATMRKTMNLPSIQKDKIVKKPRKCSICEDCVHKRRNPK